MVMMWNFEVMPGKEDINKKRFVGLFMSATRRNLLRKGDIQGAISQFYIGCSLKITNFSNILGPYLHINLKIYIPIIAPIIKLQDTTCRNRPTLSAAEPLAVTSLFSAKKTDVENYSAISYEGFRFLFLVLFFDPQVGVDIC
jgi:hypothetical protein